MTAPFLHEHTNFTDLLTIVASEMGIDPSLVEKDYWIMHSLYGLAACGLTFKLKGGTSLSKAFGIIHRFSEDIDLQIDPPEDMDVKTSKNHDRPAHRAGREGFYDQLANTIRIDGISDVQRDKEFDDVPNYMSGGIRLTYPSKTAALEGVKPGILLEAGFDTVEPHEPVTISSWAYDRAAKAGVDVRDNRAFGVRCYHPGYTFVEKLQAISTKYRRFCEGVPLPPNFLRHYYDVYCLLEDERVLAFIGTGPYHAHKERRFPKADNRVISKNEAFVLTDASHREHLAAAYGRSRSLYYRGQPPFNDIIDRIAGHRDRL